METVRLLYLRKKDNSGGESVYFTQDFETASDDFCKSGWICFLDQEIEMDTTQFPMDYEMIKEQ